MKTKISKRVISAVLAIVLAFSCTIPAFAAENYTATYTEKATKEVYTTILKDANIEIGKAALTGETLKGIYVVVPNLKPVLPEAITADFYKKIDAQAFAKLDEFMTTNSHKDVTAEVLNAYLTENPIVVKDNDDFTAKLKTLIDAIITPNVYSTVVMVIALGSSMTPSIGDAKIGELTASVDNICKALGVNQEKTLYDVLLAGEDVDSEVKRTSLVTYINNIIDALLPNIAENVVDIMKNIASDENNALLYKGSTTLFTMFSDMLTTVGPMIGSFVPGLDLAPIQQPVNSIKEVLNALPTVGEGDAKKFVYDESLAYIVNDVVAPNLAGKRMDIITFDPNANGMLKLDKFNLANITNAKDTTDTFNVILNYLYNNLNKDVNKDTIGPLLPFVPQVAPQVPAVVVDYLGYMLENTQEDSAFELYALLRIGTGHSSDMGDLVPSTPVENPDIPWTDLEPSTPIENPDIPWTDLEPATPVEKPVSPAKPVNPAAPVSPVNPIKPVLPGTTTDTDVKSPKTGVAIEGTTVAMVVMATAALGLVGVAVLTKKKSSNNA